MRKSKTNKAGLYRLLPMFALMLCMGVFLFAGTTAYAASDPVSEIIEAITENLSVDDVWLTGDIIHIVVTDKNTGINQKLEMNLRDYAGIGDEFVTIQAVDRAGNISNSIQFKNPFYSPPAVPQSPNGNNNQSAVPDGARPAGDGRPFTPDGTGTVVDNVTDGDGKEFFSISTENGNVFYLIVDRQRNTDNVYLLNAVTEHDLMSLAKPGDGRVSAVPEPPNATSPATQEPSNPAETTPPAQPAKKPSGGNNALVFVIIAAVAVGGVGYYFKIVRPKREAADDYDSGYDEPDGDADITYDSEESEVERE